MKRTHWDFVILKGNKRQDGTFKIVLRVKHQRKSKYYPVTMDHQSIYVTQTEFNKLGTSSKKKLNSINEHLNEKRAYVSNIFKNIGLNFSFDRFKELYDRGHLLSDCFREKIKELDREGRYSSRNGYIYTMNSFKKYNDIPIEKVDVPYIKKYIEIYGNRPTYLRYLRHILKRNGNNTFDHIKIENTQKHKTPLAGWELKSLKSYQSLYPGTQRVVDFWLMGYYGGGMNTKDWYFLKWENIKNDMAYITKHRSKTEEPITIPITTPLKKLIIKHANPDGIYVFGFITTEDKEAQFNKYNSYIRYMGRRLNAVAKELNFKNKLTPYVSRHTHAHVLLNKNVPLEAIRDSLGQKDIKSTQVYTHTLLDNKKLFIANLLVDEEE